MKKVTGIKSVDFKITALGHGMVNWNGPTQLSHDGANVTFKAYLSCVAIQI